MFLILLVHKVEHMKSLVTGGLGFIGSHIAKRLSAEGNSVCVLDSMHTGTEANLGEGCELKKGKAGEIGSIGISGIDVIFHERHVGRVNRKICHLTLYSTNSASLPSLHSLNHG